MRQIIILEYVKRNFRENGLYRVTFDKPEPEKCTKMIEIHTYTTG
jgi:hypothetical protein